ncbi:HlyD family efflux transporter periplasmic adaptor subunit [Desulfoluna sp.]|uniref:HlyD family secretion protein n=1 Tax=Desulfoluna sp. TaxID=2045199 RepID=UPI00260CCB11|nr:HlyD family efflux transporter periplasmic adaptor subunit [Desulfoluna sp.]
MKISFREGGTSQKPVTPAQVEMKGHQRKKVPVGKAILICVLVVGGLFIGYALYTRNTLYTYGIVSGDTAPVTAWFPTEIQTVFVAKGAVVKKGEVLFTQVSTEGEAQLKAAEVALHGKMRQYELMAGARLPVAGEDTGEGSDALTNERELLDLKQQGTAIARDRLRSEARYEQSRLKTLYEAKKERHENLQKLYRLDAATRSQVTAAETEKKLRYNEYLLARDHYNQVLKANRIAKAEAQKEGRKLESILRRDSIKTQTDVQVLLSEIETARAHLNQLQTRYGSASYKAPFDAIITDLRVTSGSVLNTGDTILTSASLTHLWADVYVDARDASLFTKEKEILLYSEGSNQSVPGKISTQGTVQLRVPPLLSEKMPNISSAVYFHVLFENKGQMLPGNIVKVVVR